MGERGDGGLQKGAKSDDPSSTDPACQGEDGDEERAGTSSRTFFYAYITKEPFTDFTAEPYEIFQDEPYETDG